MEGQCSREPRWYPAGIAHKCQAPQHLYRALFKTYEHSFIPTCKIYLSNSVSIIFSLFLKIPASLNSFCCSHCAHDTVIESHLPIAQCFFLWVWQEQRILRAGQNASASWRMVPGFCILSLMVGMDLYWSEDKKNGNLEPWGEWKAESMTLGSLKLCYDQHLKWPKTFTLL